MEIPKPKRITDRDLLNESHTKRCVICHRYGCDPDHTKTKGSGGSDSYANIIHLCRVHHIEKGQKGITFMANKYHGYRNALVARGWEFDEVRQKWVCYEK